MIQSPLIPIAIAFASGIAVAPYFYLTPRELLTALLLSLGLSLLTLRLRRYRPALVLAWLGFALVGTILAEFEQAPPSAGHLEWAVQHGEVNIGSPMVISGWIQKPAENRPGTYVFDLAVEQVEQAGKLLPARGTIRVYNYPKNPEQNPLHLDYGTRVRLGVANLRAPRNYANPGMFDYAQAMKRQGISYTALLRNEAGALLTQPGSSGNSLQRVVYHIRGALLASVERLFPHKILEQSILKAMLLGDDNWLQEDTEQAFQRSGTYHVLVISGWNVAVFAGPLLLIFSGLRLPNWVSSLSVLLAVVSFALISQSEIPIVRASAMFLIYLTASFFFRRRALLNSLAAAALFLLVIHPSDLFDWGFQLSFLAVLTLAGIALPAAEWKVAPYRQALQNLSDSSADPRFAPAQGQFRGDLRTVIAFLSMRLNCSESSAAAISGGLRRACWLVLGLAEALLFTAMMQVGYSLITAQYFHRLTWSGIFGNLLILPLASCIVLLGMILLPVELMLPLAGKVMAPILGWLCRALVAIAGYAGDFSQLSFRVPTPPLWLSACFTLTALSLAILLYRRSRWSPAAAGLLLACCLALSWTRGAGDCPQGELELTAMDVGQGDALLVCFPQGHTMLVDAGGIIPIPGSPVRRQDIGETVVSSYLWARGISRLDYVVLSHDHFDHMGGLESVFANFPVGEFWMGPDAQDRNMEWLRKLAQRSGGRPVWPVRSGGAGTFREIDGVKIQILSPPGNWAPARVSNDDSIVLRLSYGERSILLAGDIEARMERLLVNKNIPIKSDILKVAHHGSRTSTTPEFLQVVAPAVSLISVGAYARFGHPNAGVVERLSAHGHPVYLTPSSGAISVRTNGRRIAVDRFRDHARSWPVVLEGN